MHTFSSRDLSQTGQTEKDSGMSPTEFLAVVCEMIIKEQPLIPPIVFASGDGVRDSPSNFWEADILRAKSGLDSLLRRSDCDSPTLF